MTPRATGVWAIGLAVAMTAATLAALPEAVMGASRPLTPAQYELIAKKQQARTTAGQPASVVGFTKADPAAGARHYVVTVQVSTDLRSVEIPMTEIGSHSMSFSQMTYGQPCCPTTDPINILWWDVGSAWDVNYDLNNWVRNPWVATSGSDQDVYIDDSIHGGPANFRTNQFQLKPSGDDEFPWPRTHVRLFGGFVTDSHSPGYGNWTVGDAHHDNMWHTCSDDWQGPANRLQDTFRDANGLPLWFVANFVWGYSYGPPAGTIQCAYYDGSTVLIELIH